MIIDIPFALPTIVGRAGAARLYGPSSPLGSRLARTRASRCFLAFLFVTLPFVVRTRCSRCCSSSNRRWRRRLHRSGPVGFITFRPDHPADARAGDHRRRGAQLRPGAQRVRLAGAAVRQPALLDRGRLGPHPLADRAATSSTGAAAVAIAARRGARGHRRPRHHLPKGGPPCLTRWPDRRCRRHRPAGRWSPSGPLAVPMGASGRS